MPVSSFINSIVAARIGPAAADATRLFRLGERATGNENGTFVYASFAAAAAEGQIVTLNASFAASLVTTTNSPRGQIWGVVRGAPAAGQFAWVQVGGQAPVSVLALCAANARLNTTATAGTADDDATTGAKVLDGGVLTAANGGATANVEAILSNPVIGVTL